MKFYLWRRRRGGSRREPRHCKGFRDVCEEVGLVDLGYLGPRFTWKRGNTVRGVVRERLDRFLCTTAWSSIYPVTGVRVLPRYSSDHSPILLSTILWEHLGRQREGLTQNRRFEAMWLDHQEGNRIIVESWNKGDGLQVQE